MSRRKVLFAQIPLAFATFVVYTALSILIRRHKDISRKSGTLISIYCSAITTIISFLIKRESIRGILIPTTAVVTLFFISVQLYIGFSPALSAMYTTICMQPRLIIVYVFSIVFMKNRLRFSNIFGIVLIIISLLLLGQVKQEKSERNLFYACFPVAIGSACSGVAFFIFDYKIRRKIRSPHAYITFSQALTFLLSVAFLVGKRVVFGKWEDFSSLKSLKFHNIAILYTAFTYCTFATSFVFSLIPRILSSIIIHTSADIITEWWIEGGLKADILCRYAVCILGVIVYQYSNIRAYFAKKRVGIPRNFEAHGNRPSETSRTCAVTSGSVHVE